MKKKNLSCMQSNSFPETECANGNREIKAHTLFFSKLISLKNSAFKQHQDPQLQKATVESHCMNRLVRFPRGTSAGIPLLQGAEVHKGQGAVWGKLHKSCCSCQFSRKYNCNPYSHQPSISFGEVPSFISVYALPLV